MKIDELRKMTAEELKKELIDSQREHFNLRMQIRTGQLTRSHFINEVKTKIARIKTILRQKELTGS